MYCRKQIEFLVEFVRFLDTYFGEKWKRIKEIMRIRDVYVNGQVSYIDILDDASGFTDFTTRYDLIRRILKPIPSYSQSQGRTGAYAHKKKEWNESLWPCKN